VNELGFESTGNDSDRRDFIRRMAVVGGLVAVPVVASFSLTSGAAEPTLRLGAPVDDGSNVTTTAAPVDDGSNVTTTAAPVDDGSNVTTTAAPTTVAPTTVAPTTTAAPTLASVPTSINYRPGGRFAASGAHFPPLRPVEFWIRLSLRQTARLIVGLEAGTFLGSTTADAAGRYSAQITIPLGTSPGSYRIEARSGTTVVSSPIVISAPEFVLPETT
jgi:hypothetical protein